MYDTYSTKFYYGRHVETFKLHFKYFVEHNLKEIEHRSILTYWKRNLDKYAYKENLIKNI